MSKWERRRADKLIFFLLGLGDIQAALRNLGSSQSSRSSAGTDT